MVISGTRVYLRAWYSNALLWLRRKGGPTWRVDHVFLWNLNSWDIQVGWRGGGGAVGCTHYGWLGVFEVRHAPVRDVGHGCMRGRSCKRCRGWCLQGVSPEATTKEGTYRDELLSSMITAYNYDIRGMAYANIPTMTYK